MKRFYFCPHCKATLNPNTKIILAVSRGKRRGLALFSPQPGNYKVILPEDLTFKEGDKVSFHCPICQTDLVSDVHKKLAKIKFRTSDGVEGRVNFSQIFGQQATFFVTDERVRAYGQQAETYNNINFFGEGLEDD